MTAKLYLLLITFISFSLFGCGSFGVQVKSARTTATPPSDVTVALSVRDSGEPVVNLKTSAFKVYENDVLLDSSKIGLRLLPRDETAAGHTVLLLDLSSSPSKEELKAISRGARHFVTKVSTTQSITVVAFDGSERSRKIAEFSRVEIESKRELPSLTPFLSTDSSRDLNSALLSAIDGLTAAMKRQGKQLGFGSIVTLARGPDLAGRKSKSEMKEALSASGYQYFSLSPTEADIPGLGSIGADAQLKYESIDELPIRFQELGMRVRDEWFSNYLISYCSPARAGTREVKVTVEFEDIEGIGKDSSSKSSFSADGFTGGCVPKDATGSAPKVVEAEAPPEIEVPEAPKPATRPRKTRRIGPAPPKKEAPRPIDDIEEEEDGEVIAPPSSAAYD